jgi:hypothetical protein
MTHRAYGAPDAVPTGTVFGSGKRTSWWLAPVLIVVDGARRMKDWMVFPDDDDDDDDDDV